MNKMLERFQKLCQTFMDTINPRSRIDTIELSVHDQYILMIHKGFGQFKNYMYRDRGEDCEVSCGPDQKTLKNLNYVNAFLKDFEKILSDQNLVLTNFWLASREYSKTNYSKILEALRTILESRSTPLRVEQLIMDVIDPIQIPLILPYLDSSSIWIRDPTSHEDWRAMNRTESKIVKISTAKFPNSLIHFLCFPSVMAYVDKMEVEEVENVRKFFQDSPTMTFLCINFRDFESQELFVDCLGPIVNGSWYFRMTNSKDVLELCSKDPSQQLIFKRILASEVPEDVVIRD